MISNTQKPKYHQLAEMLRSQMESGELQVGARLPSFVQMYRTYGATETTMRRVYEILEKENLIERRAGSGIYVAEPKSNLTGNIGLIGAQDISYYYHDLLRGIEKFTANYNQHLLFLGNSYNTDMGLCGKVDGVLICNIEYQQQRLKHLPATLPRVSIFTKEEYVTNVIADNHGGAKAAVRHLLQLGHRRIACLIEKPLSIPRQRLAGYQEALHEAGIELQTEWTRLTAVTSADANPQNYLKWGRTQMRQWLREGWSQTGCTALLVQNDSAAVGVMQTLQEEGIRVPTDVSVIGFDGTELCDHVTPSLCSMKVPLEEMGYEATMILHQHIQQEKREFQTVMLPMALRAGGSVAPPRSSFNV